MCYSEDTPKSCSSSVLWMLYIKQKRFTVKEYYWSTYSGVTLQFSCLFYTEAFALMCTCKHWMLISYLPFKFIMDQNTFAMSRVILFIFFSFIFSPNRLKIKVFNLYVSKNIIYNSMNSEENRLKPNNKVVVQSAYHSLILAILRDRICSKLLCS